MFFFFSSRRRHTRFDCDWSSDVCSSDLTPGSRRSAPRRRSVVRSTAGSSEPTSPYSAPCTTWRTNTVVTARTGTAATSPATPVRGDRESVVEGKRGDLGGRRVIEKKKERKGRLGIEKSDKGGRRGGHKGLARRRAGRVR